MTDSPSSGVAVLDSLEPSALLAEQAYAELSRAILSGRLPSGSRMSVPELARQLDISRSPVREAVQRLTYDGLVEHRGRRGGVVAELGPAAFLALLEVREPLEGVAARLAAQRINADDAARLQGLLERHQELIEHTDSGCDRVADHETAHADLDLAFHALLRDLAGNDDLTAMLGRTQARAHLSYGALWRTHREPAEALAEHRAVVNAVVAGDADAAEEAARRHIRLLGGRVQRHTGEGP